MVLVAFLIAPGDIASKTHVALHGLCAQRPSHSLQIGGTTLPMDARMTGIYLGAAATVSLVVAARRLRATRAPSLPVLVLLASFVVALAVDGFNALLRRSSIPDPLRTVEHHPLGNRGARRNRAGCGARPSVCKLDLGSRRSGASGGHETCRAPCPDRRLGERSPCSRSPTCPCCMRRLRLVSCSPRSASSGSLGWFSWRSCPNAVGRAAPGAIWRRWHSHRWSPRS